MGITEVLQALQTLSDTDLSRVQDYLNSLILDSNSFETILSKKKFQNGVFCPHCNSIHIKKNGHKDTIQRFLCKDCGKTFTSGNNTITFSSKKSYHVWKKYIECMMNGFSVRKSASICGINKDTAFIWRHKILDALQNMAASVNLNGIVEADETFFPLSFKGNHKNARNFVMPRESRRRGKSCHKRGLSREKVCVPCAVNRNGLSISIITNLGRVSAKDLHTAFDGRIAEKSVLVTDEMNSYHDLAKTNNLELIQLKSGKSKLGVYNIQHVNNYHSTLKHFIDGFKGVSTKYLSNYLIWNNFVNYAKEKQLSLQTLYSLQIKKV